MALTAVTSGSEGAVFCGYYDTLGNNNYMDIRPDATYEAVIHNIQWEGAVEIYKMNGANEFTFDSDAGAGGYNFVAMHVTNAHYYRIKNVSGGNIDASYDGIFTKEP